MRDMVQVGPYLKDRTVDSMLDAIEERLSRIITILENPVQITTKLQLDGDEIKKVAQEVARDEMTKLLDRLEVARR